MTERLGEGGLGRGEEAGLKAAPALLFDFNIDRGQPAAPVAPSPPLPLFPPAAWPFSVLSHCGTGSQGHVFGDGNWAVKIPRVSSLSLLQRFLVRAHWMEKAARDLDGLLLPFEVRHNFQCQAPRISSTWQNGRVLPCPPHHYQTRKAVVFPQLPPNAFLSFVMENSPAREVMHALILQMELLEEVSRRGYVMMDFIRGNFAFWNGGLVIADPGCLFPKHALWEPTRRISVRLFQHYLLRDYQRSLDGLQGKLTQADEKSEIINFSAEYGLRMRRLFQLR